MADFKSQANTAVGNMADAAKKGTDAAERAGHNIVDKATDLAKQGGQAVGQMVDKGKEAVGNLMEQAGETGKQVQRWAGDAYEATTEKVKEGVDGATDLIRKYPIPALLVGFGVGLLIGRMLRG